MAIVKFLGTAGARFVVARQLRSSAGTYIEAGGVRGILDPGPGTLARCAAARPRIDATALDAIFLTHNHVDHSGDANALLDAMTAGGGARRGALFAPRECLEGEDAVILGYLRKRLARIQVLEPETAYALDGLRFRTTVRHHHTAETYGLRFDCDGTEVAFLPDTRAFDGLAESYAGTDVLVLNVVRAVPFAAGGDDVLHLTVDEAREILRRVRPRRAVLTHFGMTMLKAKPWTVAERLSAELGLDVTAASDGLTLRLPEDLAASGKVTAPKAMEKKR